MKANSFKCAAALIALFLMMNGCGGGSTSGDSPGAPPGQAATGSFTPASGPLETSEGKPVIRMFGTTSCPHCIFIAGMFDNVAREYAAAGKVVARHWQLDTGDDTLTPGAETSVPAAEMDVLREFNPGESVPTVVIAGRYFRIGTAYEGVTAGLSLEEQDLRAAIDEVIREAAAGPAVTTLAATSVTSSGATLNAIANANGLPTTVWFEWGRDAALTTPVMSASQAIGPGTAGVPVSQPIGGLADSSTCYYRAVAQNGAGTTRGEIVRFVTREGSSALVFDEGLSTVLRGALVDNAAAASLSIPAGYFHVREFRNAADTNQMCITVGILRNYYESTWTVGDPEPNLPREDEEWVFSHWEAWSYDGSGRTAVVSDRNGHTLAFDIRFNRPSAGFNTVVSATIDGVPIALSTQNYLSETLNSYGWTEEPAWYVPPN